MVIFFPYFSHFMAESIPHWCRRTFGCEVKASSIRGQLDFKPPRSMELCGSDRWRETHGSIVYLFTGWYFNIFHYISIIIVCKQVSFMILFIIFHDFFFPWHLVAGGAQLPQMMKCMARWDKHLINPTWGIRSNLYPNELRLFANLCKTPEFHSGWVRWVNDICKLHNLDPCLFFQSILQDIPRILTHWFIGLV